MTQRFDAVLFDCDGVLVDSEDITNGVLRDMLDEAGWSLTPRECFSSISKVASEGGLGVQKTSLKSGFLRNPQTQNRSLST